MGDAPDGVAWQARRALLVSLAVTAALYLVPGGEVIGYPLVLVATFVHEMGHGLAAELVGGRFESLRVFADGSGVAVTATSGGRVARAVVAAGGLLGPALAAAVGFTVGRSVRWARAFLVVSGVVLLGSAVVWVRSAVGLAIALSLAVVSLLVGVVVRRGAWSQVWVVLLSVQLGLSVFSRGEYLFARTAVTGAGVGRSDSAAIAEALVLPYWVWGTVCGLISIAVLAYGAWGFLRAAAGPGREDGESA